MSGCPRDMHPQPRGLKDPGRSGNGEEERME